MKTKMQQFFGESGDGGESGEVKRLSLEDLFQIKLCPPELPPESEDSEDDETLSLQRLFRREGGAGLQMLFPSVDKADDPGSKDGSTLFVASTAAIDRMGDIVEQSWRLRAFLDNPVILLEHGSHVVGRGVPKLNKAEDRLEIRSYWDESELNPEGQLMAHQHRNGFRRASSVGFRPGQAINRLDLKADDPRRAPENTPRWRAGHVFRYNELLELSTVAVPANPEALQLGLHARSISDDPERQARTFFAESLDAETTAKMIEAFKGSPEFADFVRSLIWSAATPPDPDTKPDPFARLFPR